METFMITGIALAGKSLVVNLIGDVYYLAKETGNYPKVKSVLDSLDLEADLHVIEALLQQIEEPKKTEVDILFSRYSSRLTSLSKYKKINQSDEKTCCKEEEKEEPTTDPETDEEEILVTKSLQTPENPDPIRICLDGVHQMISKIKGELEDIQQVIKDHPKKWFARWRSPAYDQHLRAIIHYKKILDKRVEMLIKILNLKHQSY